MFARKFIHKTLITTNITSAMSSIAHTWDRVTQQEHKEKV